MPAGGQPIRSPERAAAADLPERAIPGTSYAHDPTRSRVMSYQPENRDSPAGQGRLMINL